MRILFLSPWYPFPPDNGAKQRVYHLATALARRHELDLVTLIDGGPPPDLAHDTHGINVRTLAPTHPKNPRRFGGLDLGLVGSQPRSVSAAYHPELAWSIADQVRRGNYDIVIASGWQTALYWKCFSDTPSIYEELELGVHFTKMARADSWLEKVRHRLSLLKLRRYLRSVLPEFRRCTVVSNEERRLLASLIPEYRSVSVVPNGVDVPDDLDGREDVRHNSMIYCGSLTYFANLDAVRWFLAEIYPIIKSELDGACFILTGDHADFELPEAEGVEKTGMVDDVHRYVRQSMVSVAPIRVGGGTRIKILEAMANGTPVVSTTKGAEGLGARSGEHLMLADSAQEFAAGVVRLFQDGDLYRRIQVQAHDFVRTRYDWSTILPTFLDVVESA
jgi:glycosyltransferase involved in cell wall biosynthesis